MASSAACDAGAYPRIERVFGDCVYDQRDFLGFCCGMASICCWMVAQMPQIVRNARTQSAEALSPFFLAEWLMGDTFNLIGCILTGDQLRTMTFSAMYFICADVVLVLQYIFYSYYAVLLDASDPGSRVSVVVDGGAGGASGGQNGARHHHHRHHRHQQQGKKHHHRQDDPRKGDDGGGASSPPPTRHGAARSRGATGGATAAASAAAGGAALISSSVAEGAPTTKNEAEATLRQRRQEAKAREVEEAEGEAVAPVDADGERRRSGAGASSSGASTRPLLQVFPSSSSSGATTTTTAAAGATAALAAAELQNHHRHRRGGGGSPSTENRGPTPSQRAGTLVGWLSAAFYTGSRLSQLAKNAKRGTAEGLSMEMFGCAITANFLYGASILLRAREEGDVRRSLPWVAATASTIALDVAIFMQAAVLEGARRRKEEERRRRGRRHHHRHHRRSDDGEGGDGSGVGDGDAAPLLAEGGGGRRAAAATAAPV